MAFFIGECSPGEHTFKYGLRVTQPGEFRVLPTLGYGMYRPDVRGHTASYALQVADKPIAGPQTARLPGAFQLAWMSLWQ